MHEQESWTEMTRLRHSASAQFVRRLAYNAFVGGTAWPLKFKACRDAPPEEQVQNLYFHMPFCRSLCPHCPYLKRRYQPEQAAEYSRAIQREAEDWLESTPHLPLQAVYFGGGTPALLFDGISGILDRLSSRIDRNTGIGLELHPADVTPDLLTRLRHLGVNRVSLGVESLQALVLRQLGRGIEPKEVLHAVELLAGGGFGCVDANLIYGVDGQSPDGVLRDAETLIDLGVDQISAYHARSATPILNWYLYVYGITVLCLFAGARLLARPRNEVAGINVPPMLYALGTVLAFLLVNIEIADFFSQPGASVLTFQFSGDFARDMSYSIAWALFALLLLVVGIAKRLPPVRYASIALLAVTLLKLFLHDLSQLEQLYRIAAFIVVAVIAMLASFLYQRFLGTPEKSNETDPAL